jgi:DnaJ-class molecular chaperone
MTDPFQTLGVSRTASDAELRAAYRRLVQLHHPDHNGGSAESARRFEEVQEAYAQARRLRQARGGAAGSSAPPRAGRRATSSSTSRSRSGSSPREDDSDIGSRLAAMEAELRAARDEAVRQARRARQAAARAQGERQQRASDEELGYISTDDSFSKILSDAASGIGERLNDVQKEARDSPVTKRFADLLDELGSKLTGEPPDRHKPN